MNMEILQYKYKNKYCALRWDYYVSRNAETDPEGNCRVCFSFFFLSGCLSSSTHGEQRLALGWDHYVSRHGEEDPEGNCIAVRSIIYTVFLSFLQGSLKLPESKKKLCSLGGPLQIVWLPRLMALVRLIYLGFLEKMPPLLYMFLYIFHICLIWNW